MTREIKFSYIWQHKERGCWLERVFTLEDMENPNAVNIIRGFRARWTFVARRQFTGLKDKNGKEIYKGDIVNVHLGKLPATVILPAQIIYSNECQFIAQGIGNHGHWTLNSSHIEVIGSVTENPDLLEKKQ